MKYIVVFLFVMAFFACAKEDALENQIDFTNIYAITDDPNDPVQHERYNLYQEFGVSVYFNDTINRAFVKNDVYGNPVYRYEVIDPSWLFYRPETGSSTTSSYVYEYAEGEEKQLAYLDGVRVFLKEVSPALHPTLMFLADTIIRVGVEEPVTFSTNFRLMLWTGVDKLVEDGTLEESISEIETSLVSDKIENYTTQIDEFGSVSEASYYGRQDLYALPTTEPWWNFYSASMFYYGYPQSMNADYPEVLQDRFDALYGQEDYWIVPEEYWEESRTAWTAVAGPFGFVCASDRLSSETPRSVTEDLQGYLQQILQFGDEGFRAYWGSYSLVMRKYNILYDVLVNEIGIEL